MFRATRTLSSLKGLPRRPVLTVGTRPATILLRQPQQPPIGPSIIQRAVFSSNKDDKVDPPPPKQPIDYEAERKIGERKLESRPSEVSMKSSISNERRTPVEHKADAPILKNELNHDMGIIKDTFSLENVPHESKVLGLAGTIPYFFTSLSTIYLGWDLKQEVPTGNAFYDALAIDHSTAQYLLGVIEPVQLGYGAVIISFLGAIHWGLEYAEKKPNAERTRFRYGMGLIASVVAWPTLIMPVPYALTTQFLAFVGLYFADARATTRGWAPTWYGSYRFMLTAMVGVALFVSLIGRQKMGQGGSLTQEGLKARLEQTGRADHDTDWAKLEAEEKKRLRKEKAETEKKAEKEAEKKEKKDEEARESKSVEKSDSNGTKEVKKKGKEEEKQNKEDDNGDGEDQSGDDQDKKEDKEDKKEDKKDGKKDGKKKDDKKDDKKNQEEDKADTGKHQKNKDKKQAEKADEESQSQKGTGK